MTPNIEVRTGVPLFVLTALICFLCSAASAQWKEKVLYSFQGGADSGSVPVGGLVFDKQGNLYGATSNGGEVYQLVPPAKNGSAWTENVLYVFQGNTKGDGAGPSGGLVFDSAGNLYGVTGSGGTGDCVLLGILLGCGTVYELSPPTQLGDPWTEKVLYSFQGGNDGYVPGGSLVFDKDGNLYGATLFGGGEGTTCDSFYGGNCGTVFELSAPQQEGGQWSETVLHSFAGGSDGAVPNGGLVLDAQGRIYGTTTYGGYEGGNCSEGDVGIGCGSVFRLAPTEKGAWWETLLYVFKDGGDGASPNGNLLLDPEKGLYGTAGGGTEQNGVVFRLSDTDGQWNETVLYTFTGGDDGSNSGAGLAFSGSGYVYGTALGGKTNLGLVFDLKPQKSDTSWSFSVLYNFTGTPNANHPTAAPLLIGPSHSLYGTTQWGGTGEACQSGCGTVFELWP